MKAFLIYSTVIIISKQFSSSPAENIYKKEQDGTCFHGGGNDEQIAHPP